MYKDKETEGKGGVVGGCRCGGGGGKWHRGGGQGGGDGGDGWHKL